MAGCFLKMIGASDYPLREDLDIFDNRWRGDGHRPLPDPAVPEAVDGERAAHLLRRWRDEEDLRAARLTDAPVEEPAQPGERWPHWAPVHFDPRTVIRDLRFAPELAEVDIGLLDEVGKDVSWIHMTTRQFERAYALLRRHRDKAPPGARRPLV